MTLGEFKPFPKINRVTNTTVTVTEKIDGTNACIYFEPLGDGAFAWHVQSRKRLITPGKDTDNAGFAQWVHDHADDLWAILGPGHHYGEWYGQGIQHGYGLDHKRLALFNTSRWSAMDWTAVPYPCADVIDVVPVLFHGNLVDLDIEGDAFDLAINGSRLVPGQQAEGVMVYISNVGYLKHPFDAVPKEKRSSQQRERTKRPLPTVSDGFGSTWEGCLDNRCDIQVVRPGKAQCSNYCERVT